MPESIYRRDGTILSPAESVEEDEAHSSGDRLAAVGAVRKDTPGSLSGRLRGEHNERDG